MPTYYTLRPGEGHLMNVDIGGGADAVPRELTEAESWAYTQITEVLGKRWSTVETETPETIQELAHLLAASKVRQRVMAGSPDGLESAKKLEDLARRQMAEIKKGLQGILLRNGAWDSKYPGSTNPEQGRAGGGCRIIAR